MSAKSAAASLIANDPYITEQAMLLAAKSYDGSKREAGEQFLREIMGTWTLTLSADAAGVTEQQVIAALAYQLGLGSTVVTQMMARMLFQRKI